MNAPPTDDAATTPPSTASLLRRLLVVSLFAVLVYAAWLLWADLPGMLDVLRAVGVADVAVALAWGTANYAVRWLRWHDYLVRLGLRVPVGESVLVFVAGFTMTVTPAKMGEVMKAVLLKRSHGIAMAQTAPIVVAERMTDLIGLVVLVAFGCLAFRSGVAFVAAGSIVALLLLVLSSKRIGTWLIHVATRPARLQRVRLRLLVAYEALRRIGDARTTLRATALSTVAWFTHCWCLYGLAAAIAPGAIDVLESCVGYSGPLLGGTLVLIPGGLGATEASMTGLLRAMSEGRLDLPAAAAIALLVRVVTFWWAIALGVAALALWRARRGRAPAGH
jgi:uncharacterized protein (TIRG00374 family)